jgi:alkylation response protein AidB-like acyl-CoA dehydrogenase
MREAISSAPGPKPERWDEYVINGSKIFITNGSIADYLAVFCITDPDAESRYHRHSILMVETDRPGFEASKIKGKMGIRASDTAEFSFNNVRVPKENLVGGKRDTDLPKPWNCSTSTGWWPLPRGWVLPRGPWSRP